jgi:hypothetical protein
VAVEIKCGSHGGEQDEVVYGSLVEPQSQDRTGTTVAAKS